MLDKVESLQRVMTFTHLQGKDNRKMGKGQKWVIAEESIQMANKQRKSCSDPAAGKRDLKEQRETTL